jgi:hypothetical protein
MTNSMKLAIEIKKKEIKYAKKVYNKLRERENKRPILDVMLIERFPVMMPKKLRELIM